MIDIKSYSLDELQEYILGLGESAYRAKQIYEWLHKRLVYSFDDMTNLSLSLREKLKSECYITNITKTVVQESAIDGTKKYLYTLADGNSIETVLMRYKFGNSICISSQVGCRMGCKFCASTIDGMVRHLTVSDMLDQVYKTQLDIKDRISHVVIMGSGEPLDNFDNLLGFLHSVSHESGLNISQRNITVSTCGIVPNIYKLADLKLQITLAISLHATNDEKRRKIMPIANKYSIAQIIDACTYYYNQTGRRITFEYSLIAGVNDSTDDAKELVSVIKDTKGHVNLIPINPIKERSFKQTAMTKAVAFNKFLEKNGINATIRRELGRDIDGACGQLRRHMLNK